jgi:hypothetical protein
MQREREKKRTLCSRLRCEDNETNRRVCSFSLSLSRLSSFFASKNEKRKGKREKERRRNFVGRDHTRRTHTRKTRDFAKRACGGKSTNNKKKHSRFHPETTRQTERFSPASVPRSSAGSGPKRSFFLCVFYL